MRELIREDWLKECEEKRDESHRLVKGIVKSSFYKMREKGFYSASLSFAFDEREMAIVMDSIKETGKAKCKGILLKMKVENVLVEYPDDEEVEEWNGQIEEERIEVISLADFEDLREITGMNKTCFADYIGIPQRTLTSWNNGERECPNYVKSLINEKVMRDFKEE